MLSVELELDFDIGVNVGRGAIAAELFIVAAREGDGELVAAGPVEDATGPDPMFIAEEAIEGRDGAGSSEKTSSRIPSMRASSRRLAASLRVPLPFPEDFRERVSTSD